MYHEAKNAWEHSYYDTIEELPQEANVYFPEEKEPKKMTIEEILKLGEQGWYTIIHTCNYGCCDHWTSHPLKDWVRMRFNDIISYRVGNKVVGYNRACWNLTLTRDAHYWESAVWNS